METATLLQNLARPVSEGTVRWKQTMDTTSTSGILVEARERGTIWEHMPWGFGSHEPAPPSYRRWVYGYGLEPVEVYKPRVEPEVRIDPSASGLLTDKVRETLWRLLDVLKWEARRSFVPISMFEVNAFIDPEEDSEEVVVTEWVGVSPEAALDYWDRLGAVIEGWVDFLPTELAEIAVERLAIEVRAG